MTKISLRLSALAIAALALTTACDDTVLEPTYGEGCMVGTLTAGQTVSGSLTSSSCRVNYHFYSGNTSPYASWSVHLDAGKAYMFYMKQAPDASQEGLNDVDPVLTLWGKDDQGRSVPLAVSDDDADGVDGHDSEFWFISPKSGDFVLVASSYDFSEFGGYQLSMQTCPVLGTLDTAGVYTFASRSSSCIRHGHPDYDGEGKVFAYSFLRVNADSFESISVSVDHESSSVVEEMGGPGFDTYANIWNDTDNDYNSGGTPGMSIGTGEFPGIVTIAVATELFDAAGAYTVTFDRATFTAPPTARTWNGLPAMRSTFPKIEAKRLATP